MVAPMIEYVRLITPDKAALGMWNSHGTAEVNAVRTLFDLIHGDQPLTDEQVQQIATTRAAMAKQAGIDIYQVLIESYDHDLVYLARHAAHIRRSVPIKLTDRDDHISMSYELMGYYRDDHVTRFDGAVRGRPAYLYKSDRGQELMLLPAT